MFTQASAPPQTKLPDTRAVTYPIGLDEINERLGEIVLSMGDDDSDSESTNISQLEEMAAEGAE